MNDQGTAAAAALLAATAMQEVGLEGGGGGSDLTGAAPDMTEVLSSLQTVSTPLGSVLTPAVFSDELSVMAAGGVSTDPESLRFQYPIDEPPTSKKKAAPTVYREQDRFLPINNVSRVMRNAIPKTGKVSKDAKECMQECVSEFVSFITSEAADRCSQEKRKTLTGDDILFAMATLGFDNYIQPMKLYLQKIRDYMKLEKGVPSGRERMTLPVGTSSLTDHTALDMQSLQSTSSLSPHFTTLTYDNTT